MAFINATARTVFYAGDYDPEVPYLDFISRGSSPLGEALYTGAMSFSAFRSRVMVVNGDLDGAAWADKDVVSRTKAGFPSASEYQWIHVPSFGHDINSHRAAPWAFCEVLEKLK